THDRIGVHIDDAVIAETRIWLSGLGVQRIEFAVSGTENDLRLRVSIATPILQPARRGVARRELVRPDLFASHRVYSGHLRIRRRDVHEAVDHQRRVSAGPKSGAEHSAPAASSTAGKLGCFTRRGASTASGETRRPHVVGPGDLETANVGWRNLSERREALATGVVAVSGPLSRCRN